MVLGGETISEEKQEQQSTLSHIVRGSYLRTCFYKDIGYDFKFKKNTSFEERMEEPQSLQGKARTLQHENNYRRW